MQSPRKEGAKSPGSYDVHGKLQVSSCASFVSLRDTPAHSAPHPEKSESVVGHIREIAETKKRGEGGDPAKATDTT